MEVRFKPVDVPRTVECSVNIAKKATKVSACGAGHSHAGLASRLGDLLPGENVFAYLGDVHAVCQPERAHAVASVAPVVWQEHAGIEVHLGRAFGMRLAKNWPASMRCKDRAGPT